MSRLKKQYLEKGKADLQAKFKYKNVMQIPELKKIVVNMGLGEAVKDKNILPQHVKELSMLTGQKPILNKAKTSVSNFKLREGQEIGAKVTLRGKRMYDFLDRFINVVSPRIRDFRGFNTKGDGSGNYSVGLSDQQVFLEVNPNEVKRDQGMHITIVTSATRDEECHELLKTFGFPYKKEENN